MSKIIHLSDLHHGYDGALKSLEELIDRLVFHKKPAKDYAIVITGDLVHNGNHSELHTQVKVQLERLEAEGFPVLVVPGNHDYGNGILGNENLVDTFKRTFFGTESVRYPKLDFHNDIAFMGLDSTAEELHWYDRLWAEGELGDRQLIRLERMLERDDVRQAKWRVVYLHHHPFHPRPFHQLKDSEKLGEVLRTCGCTIHAVLFGHNHDGQVWNGHWGIPRVYDGGASLGKGGKPSPLRVIDLSLPPHRDYDMG
ncbi:MAG: metallophosphoesterase [Fibrobacteria bacterium]|nr:metallophosphoesterase [Fibrobacteria bacterium]